MIKGRIQNPEFRSKNKSHLPLRERVGVKGIIILLLFTIHCLLFTVVTGCGKKAPPKPPQEAVSVK